MTIKKGIVLIIIFLLGLPGVSFSVPAAPDIFEIDQPDGNLFPAKNRGDEWNNWVETSEGYSVKKDTDGFWYYIQHYDRDLPVFSNRRAHRPPHSGLKKHIRPEKKFLRVPPGLNRKDTPGHALSDAGEMISGFSSAPEGSPDAFNGSILFILAEFTDQSGTYAETSFGTFISNDINDYFNKASYGNGTLSPASESSGTANNGVIGWVNVGYAHPNTAGSIGDANRQLTYDAITAADPYIDFSAYDGNSDGYVDAEELAIVVVAAGYEEAYSFPPPPSVWGHRWSLGYGAVSAPVVDGVTVASSYNGGGYAQFGEIHSNHQATMGIMIHELGHLIFGFPDLYDTNDGSSGIGAFGVMASGSWGKANTDVYSGETPVLPCAWTKYYAGWVDGTESTGAVTITAAGSTSADSTNSVYKLITYSQNEYFMLENRYPVGYDAGLQRWLGPVFGGLAIWHIDESKSGNTEQCAPPSDCSTNHYKVSVEQADGLWDLENNIGRGEGVDLWYTGNEVTFNDSSMPDSNRYSGSQSYVSVTDISNSGTTMTATLSAADLSNLVTIYTEDFETGSLGTEWGTNSIGNGRILVTSANSPYSGIYHITMDSSVNGSYALNELILTIDLSGQSEVGLNFFNKEFYDEDEVMSDWFVGSENTDGVAISEDGINWYKVQGLTYSEGISSSYKQFSIDLDGAIASAGINYNSSFQIKFQQYDNFSIESDGFAFDDIQVTALGSCTDSDEDGYGSPGDASCPNGFETDCDDSDGNEYPGQTWYSDLDGDGYSDGSTIIQCLRPADHYIDTELTATSGDCDDTDGNEYPGQTWYEDVDGDLYSSGNTAVQCLRPANHYVSTELTATSGDCDDSDLNLYPGAVKVIGGSAGYYSSLQNAYVASSSGDAMQNMEETIVGDISFNQNKTVTIEGGYNCGYDSVTGLTTISGDMTVSYGTVFIGDIILQ